MKNFFMILSVGSMILLTGSFYVVIVIGTTLVAFQGHWILGTVLTLFWTSITSFYIFERLEERDNKLKH